WREVTLRAIDGGVVDRGGEREIDRPVVARVEVGVIDGDGDGRGSEGGVAFGVMKDVLLERTAKTLREDERREQNDCSNAEGTSRHGYLPERSAYTRRSGHLLPHANERIGCAVLERRGDALDVVIAAGEVHGVAAEHGHQFELAKAGGARFFFASFENHPADAAARELRQDEHGADARGIGCRLEHLGIAGAGAASGIKALAVTPAATGDDLLPDLDDEVGAVVDELAVEMRDEAKGAVDLPPVIGTAADADDGVAHDALDLRDVAGSRMTKEHGRDGSAAAVFRDAPANDA